VCLVPKKTREIKKTREKGKKKKLVLQKHSSSQRKKKKQRHSKPRKHQLTNQKEERLGGVGRKKRAQKTAGPRKRVKKPARKKAPRDVCKEHGKSQKQAGGQTWKKTKKLKKMEKKRKKKEPFIYLGGEKTIGAWKDVTGGATQRLWKPKKGGQSEKVLDWGKGA